MAKPRFSIRIGEGINSADLCRKNGWGVGTRIVGDEGYGPTVIEITALGERSVLAKKISENGAPIENGYEGRWSLEMRDWKKVP